ncbi:MAG: ATP-dependent Clp protease ATP-binding subunit ClpA [bacterium]|jgi:ATP-dependent Clp protease ATP-binding subunit ClpA|nr:ATP-dependent Clp protease ATP-binding subunit ClpA [bacterium]
MQLEKRLNNIILSAFYEAKNEKHEYVTAEHVFYSILFDADGLEILEQLQLNIDILKKEMKDYLKHNIPKSQAKKEVIQSEGFQLMLNNAASKAASSNRATVELGDVLVAIYDLEESFASYLLKNEGLERYDLLSVVSHGLTEKDDDDYEPSDDDEEISGIEKRERKEISPEKLLKKYTTDLTEKATRNELDPIIGRADILKRTIQVLLRRKKNNPVHVGEPGVGKTAITEGLAQMIVKGEVPHQLLNHTILKLDLSNVLAGTKYRGDFEERMKKIIAALEKVNDLILFIDEIHTLVGAGSAGSSSIDASNMLKPLLTEGKIKFIGATTYDEYRKHFEKDSALTRRFQKIDIPEPTILETVEILRGLSKNYEQFHKVKYHDDALKAAAELSSRYISERFLPDKAIDIIDEAGSINAMSNNPLKTIKKEQIEQVIAIATGKKESAVSVDKLKALKNLETEISSEIFGQTNAVENVVKAVKKSMAGFKPVEKPVASFLFAGPTGVGKTELARVLAKKLELPLHRFDMSEYQEKHTVAKLFGAPPGYVGYEEGGLLTEAIRKQSSCVLLLDEIEKAHSDIYNSLLQIMDYATLTDSTGRKADFKNAIIIMTSNAGAKAIGKAMTGFGERKFESSALIDAVNRTFSPEFRNRLDSIVYFQPLNPEIVKNIVLKNIRELRIRMAEKKITINITDKAVAHLSTIGFSKEFGARETARIVEEKMEKLLLDEILFGKLRKGGTVNIDINKEELVIRNISK